MPSRRSLLWITLVVVVVIVVLAELGLYRVSNLHGRTYANSPWQTGGDRAVFSGEVLVDVQCVTENANCRAIAGQTAQDHPSKPETTARIKLSIDAPPWCYTPIYKRGSLHYQAEVEVAGHTGARGKQIGFRGAVEASALGLDSCGNVRDFLLSLASRDIRRQLASALEQGTTLMWKCSDGTLRLSDDDNPCRGQH
jgi:hypothetical protein